MAIRYGFFNSSNGDRTYNADDFNRYFEGLVSQNGVFENYLDGMKVKYLGNNQISVGAGKALVDRTWIELDSAETFEIPAADTLNPRYDAVILRKDYQNRKIELKYVTGVAVSSPSAYPLLRNSASYYEIALADIRVEPNSTNYSLYDSRFLKDRCGMITVLVDQPDISTVYENYERIFGTMQQEMLAWQTEQKAQFDVWYKNLTQALNIDTNIEKYVYKITIDEDNDNQTSILLEGIGYQKGDILLVFLNNLKLIEGKDYSFSSNGRFIYFNVVNNDRYAFEIGSEIEFVGLRSRIGYNPNQGYLQAESLFL